jgi:hypothetical protein
MPQGRAHRYIHLIDLQGQVSTGQIQIKSRIQLRCNMQYITTSAQGQIQIKLDSTQVQFEYTTVQINKFMSQQMSKKTTRLQQEVCSPKRLRQQVSKCNKQCIKTLSTERKIAKDRSTLTCNTNEDQVHMSIVSRQQ